MPDFSPSVVIATRNRAEPLGECLESIARQTRVPSEVILVDASDNSSTSELAGNLNSGFTCPVRYLPARTKSSAVQRNQGIEIASGNVILFLDDDVVLEPNFIAEIVRVFEEDSKREVGGVSGIPILPDRVRVHAQPWWLDRFLMRIFASKEERNYHGRLIGPAINFDPADLPDTVQPVEWLSGCAMAYRREALLAERFWESFTGYSIGEDIHLSARVGRNYRLLNTTRARLLHKCMGSITHRDWAGLGESMVLNRHAITMHVLQRRRLRDYFLLFAFELLYCPVAQIRRPDFPWQANLQLLWGKLRGVGKLLRGKSPHRVYFS